jgi:hypothetical protein
MCLPKSTKKINAEHKFRIKFFGKGDAKMKLQLHGSLSANMTYPAPEIGWNLEMLAYPGNKISEENMRDLEEKFQSFKDMQEKRQTLLSAFEKAKHAIMADSRLKGKQRADKLENFRKKFTKDLNAEAAKLKTCIIHEAPVHFAHWFPPCLLHFSCNEWARFLKSVDSFARRFTLNHRLYDSEDGTFYRKSGPKLL